MRARHGVGRGAGAQSSHRARPVGHGIDVAAGIPEDVKFATKPELALKMLARAKKAGMTFPWVTGDSVYGNNPTLRDELEKDRQPYVLAIA